MSKCIVSQYFQSPKPDVENWKSKSQKLKSGKVTSEHLTYRILGFPLLEVRNRKSERKKVTSEPTTFQDSPYPKSKIGRQKPEVGKFSFNAKMTFLVS